MVAFYLLLYPPQKWRRHFCGGDFSLQQCLLGRSVFLQGCSVINQMSPFYAQQKGLRCKIAPKAKIFLCNMLFMKQSWLCVYETTMTMRL